MQKLLVTIALSTSLTLTAFSQTPSDPPCTPDQNVVCLDTLGLALPSSMSSPVWRRFATVMEIDEFFQLWLYTEVINNLYDNLRDRAYEVALRDTSPGGLNRDVADYRHRLYLRSWAANMIPTYTFSSTLLVANPFTLQTLVRGSTHKVELPLGNLIFSQKAEEVSNTQEKSRFDLMEKVYQPLRESLAKRVSLIMELHDSLIDARQALDARLHLAATTSASGSPDPRTMAAVVARLHKDYGLKKEEIDAVLNPSPSSIWGQVFAGLVAAERSGAAEKEMLSYMKGYQDAMSRAIKIRANLAAENAKLYNLTRGQIGTIAP